ncbi:MAG: carboxypeptidase-like regulatory domain-containing protein [Planctomycetota bacterium]
MEQRRSSWWILIALLPILAVLAIVTWPTEPGSRGSSWVEEPERAEPAQASLEALEPEVPSKSLRSKVVLERSGSGTVVGSVSNTRGQPLPAAQIVLMDDQARTRPLEHEDGRFEVTLPAARYSIHATAPGHWPLDRRIEVRSDPAVNRVDLVLEPNEIVVWIQTPDGAPLQDAWTAERDREGSWLHDNWRTNNLGFSDITVMATRDPPGREVPAHRIPERNGQGGSSRYWRSHQTRRIRGSRDRFKVEEPPGSCGILELDAPPPLFVSASIGGQVLATEIVLEGQTEVTLTLSLEEVRSHLANVRLRLVDGETGAPINRGRGFLRHPGSYMGSTAGTLVSLEGWLTLQDQAPGPRILWTSVEGYEQTDLWIELRSGDNDLGEVPIYRCTPLTVTLVPPGGVALQPKEVFLALIRLSNRPEREPVFEDVVFKCSEPQTLTWRFPCRGRYRYLVSPRIELKEGQTGGPFAINPTLVDLRGGEIADVRIPLRVGTMVRLEISPRLRELGPRIFLMSDGWLTIWSRPAASANGSLCLLPGQYSLEVESPMTGFEPQVFTVGTEPMTVTFGE